MADHCRYYIHGPSRCDITKHACLKDNGSEYEDCGILAAVEKNARRKAEAGKEACRQVEGGREYDQR